LKNTPAAGVRLVRIAPNKHMQRLIYNIFALFLPLASLRFVVTGKAYSAWWKWH